ncbi:FAD-dependent oxidoreductase [Streptomyces sp. NPDC057543]|uniref:FAD-dependent oxidoreductase n=1 Tax=Streptomyces sp. NPDC057543 TaxID=3346163 RepID=UPI0036B3C7A4
MSIAAGSTSPAEEGWDDECDVLVAGSGGGGLTGAYTAAARGLDTMLIEKTPLFGGTTAYSGASLWLPGNQAQQRSGLDDSVQKGLTYLRATVGERTSASLQESYVGHCAELVAFLEGNRHLRFRYAAFPDYYDAPGRFDRGRSVMPEDIDAADLGDLMDVLRPSWAADRLGAEVPRTRLVGGQALVGRFLLALRETPGVRLSHSTALDGLIQENGRVVGVHALRDGRRLRIRARAGVILATGGFEGSDELRRKYQAPRDARWTMGPVGANTGDALRAGISAGAGTDLLGECWWCPSVVVDESSAAFTLGATSGIFVDARGRRFANESLPYDQTGRALLAQETAGVPLPCYWIYDGTTEGLPPGFVSANPTDARPYLDSGVWKRADTLAGLAEQIGVPADELIATVERFNAFAAAGKDEDFHRGEDAYDRFFATGEGPNPSLVPLEKGPFHAVPVVLGDLGTKGGLTTDDRARVTTPDGDVVPGLYAAGNTMASVSGLVYPGPGVPIGSAMVFAHLAAEDIARQQGN